MSSAVEQPIINSPYEEPTKHYVFEDGQPRLEYRRRPAGFYLQLRTRARAGALAAEEFKELDLINEIRRRVGEWRRAGYPGTTRITQDLLRHWNAPEREQRLFFCQQEAAETIIWLVEASPAAHQGISIPLDQPNDPESLRKGYGPLRRYACKMATASGKTVVMAMLIAWSVLNKVYNPQDRRFSDAILVLCPNLTIKKRLSVLKPSDPDNYYEKFDLVPRSLLPALARGRYLVTNWQAFAPQDDESKRGVVKRGPESDRAFCNRVLADLGPKKNILVLNDEAHHAYRPALPEEIQRQLELEKLSAAERRKLEEERREATVWVNALDRINATRSVNFCVDLSATPFYIKGSGHPEGTPFPWMVSDFGLVDAIECGIVKTPRIPVDDNSGEPIPRYFHIWKWVMDRLPSSERATARRKAKPEAVLRQAEGALTTLASEWKRTFDEFQANGFPVPPVMIVVCDNTDLAELVADYIGKHGKVLPELQNVPGQEPTLRIDTKLLEKAESAVEGLSQKDAAELLREKVGTVGKVGKPGEQVRCVISVGMLNEGWDAQNVTQILGLRAFTSQLLCEQVVGRGLRRTSYDDLSAPEYVDVYGVPFEVIPVKRTSLRGAEPPRLSTLVQALPDRKHLEIRFPRVEGYVFDVRHRIKADIDSIPELVVDPSREPTEVVAKGTAGYRIGRPDRLGPGKEFVHDRDPFYRNKRLQATIFEIAARVTNNLNPGARSVLFPQVLRIVWDYLENRVRFIEAKKEELALLRYLDVIVERLSEAIQPDTSAGEAPLLPKIERFRPVGSTSEVLFRTTRYCYGTTKSHVSHVVADSSVWEHSVAYHLEQHPAVVSYVKNDHLDFEIPYEFEGQRANYRPDFLVRLRREDSSLISVILEVKGYETERDRAKETAARRWVAAVNHHGEFGKWVLVVCKDPRRLSQTLSATDCALKVVNV